jgi:hypothetical protein
MTSGSPRSAALSLGQLTATLGAGVLQVLTAPRDLAVDVERLVIHDASEPEPLARGDLVIGVGVAGEQALLELIRRAGSAEAGAIIVRSRTAVTDLAAAVAAECGVALLIVVDDLPWDRVHALVRTWKESAAQHRPVLTPATVPLGDLFALANAVAGLAGGHTTIEGPSSEILAYSSLDLPIDEPRRESILARKVPQRWLESLRSSGVMRRLATAKDVIRVEPAELGDVDGEIRTRYAVAVRAGHEIVGSIWVVKGDWPMDDGSLEALREAGRIAALHLLRHRVRDDVEQHARQEALTALLFGRGPVRPLTESLGLAFDGDYTVVVVDMEADDDTLLAVTLERLLGMVTLYNEVYFRHAGQVAVRDRLYVLLPLAGPGSQPLVDRLASGVLEHSEDRGPSVIRRVAAGVGSTVHGAAEIPRARAEAEQVLRVLRRRPEPRATARIDQVRHEVFLLELRDLVADRPHLLEGKLQRVLEHHAKHPTWGMQTLRAHLDAQGNIPRAAESLAVHPNTFRYRLQRILEAADLDLSDPEERLALEIQLRLVDEPGAPGAG